MNTHLMYIKNFKSYTPEPDEYTEADLASLLSAGLIFLKSEDGQDCYQSQQLFRPDTIKFTYDEQGIVRSSSRDVSGLWPVDRSVAEAEDNEANSEVDISGNWIFRDPHL